MFEKLIIVIGAVLLIGLGWLAFHAQGKWDECRNKGGYVVELTSGYICAKLEVVK
jgi:hypothetical protein